MAWVLIGIHIVIDSVVRALHERECISTLLFIRYKRRQEVSASLVLALLPMGRGRGLRNRVHSIASVDDVA